MLVLKNKVKLSDVVSVMWANEEEGGVQMLGCMAISRLVKSRLAQPGDDEIAKVFSIAIPSVSAETSFTASGTLASIVASMQSHVSDAIVQEIAFAALRNIVKVGVAER